MIKVPTNVIDFLVPFGILLRKSEDLPPFDRWRDLVLRFIPHSFFVRTDYRRFCLYADFCTVERTT